MEFSYDAAGRLKVRTDQRGDFVAHMYDLAGRRTVREDRSLARAAADEPDDMDQRFAKGRFCDNWRY